MGLGKFIRKTVRKVAKAVGIGGGGGGGSPSQPTPAPELELQNTQGEAEEKKETEKVVRKRGKKALKISKKDTPVVSAGRNIV